MPRLKLKIEVVPLGVAHEVLAEELKRKHVVKQAKRSKGKPAKQGRR